MQMPYVSQITLNTGDSISLSPDSILVFVGPNNVGKSQAIRDIYALASGNANGILVNSELIEKPDIDDVDLFMKQYAVRDSGQPLFHGLHFQIYGFDYREYPSHLSPKDPLPDGFREAYFSFLNTEDRLTVWQSCSPD